MLREESRPVDLQQHNVAEHGALCLALERWISTQELKNEYAQIPVVNTWTMAFSLYHLWREVLGRAAVRIA